MSEVAGCRSSAGKRATRRPWSLFVRRNGVQEDYEREDIIRMLTTKPDKRLVVKQNTKGILRDLES